jgi:hypothetical protein
MRASSGAMAHLKQGVDLRRQTQKRRQSLLECPLPIQKKMLGAEPNSSFIAN